MRTRRPPLATHAGPHPQRSRGFASDGEGAAAVEFALVAPIFVLVLVGIMEFGLYFFNKHALEFAMEETGRSVMTMTSISESDVVASLKERLVGVAPEAVAATVVTDTVGVTTYATITVNYSYNLAFGGFFGLDPIPIEAKTRVPLNPPE